MLPIRRSRCPAPHATVQQAGASRRCSPLAGKRIYIPPMAYGSARAFAAAFRAIGLDAEPTPPSDHRTRELGARYTSGDECYPAKVTVGDFMKVLEDPARRRPRAHRLFHAHRRRPLPLRTVCALPAPRAGFERLSAMCRCFRPSSKNAYGGLGDMAQRRSCARGWRALLAADILQKLLLQYRPYELEAGRHRTRSTRAASTTSAAPSKPRRSKPAVQLAALHDALVRARDRFRAIPGRRDRATPLIGIVGEIFCRLNTFSNENLVRRWKNTAPKPGSPTSSNGSGTPIPSTSASSS